MGILVREREREEEDWLNGTDREREKEKRHCMKIGRVYMTDWLIGCLKDNLKEEESE